MWNTGLNHCLPFPASHVRVPVGVPAALLLIQLHMNVFGKGVKNDPSDWILTNQMGDQVEVPDSLL